MGGRLPRGLAVLFALIAVAPACNGGGDAPAPSSTSSTAPGPTTTTTAPCAEGSRTVTREGTRIREFCGPARARVTVGEATFDFAGGTCERHSDWFALNIGLEFVDPGPPDDAEAAFRSFTVLMGKHPLAAEDAVPVAADGVYTSGVLTFSEPPVTYLMNDKTVTLLATRTAGTFSGLGVIGAAPEQTFEVRGLFTCDEEAVPLQRVPELAGSEPTD